MLACATRLFRLIGSTIGKVDAYTILCAPVSWRWPPASVGKGLTMMAEQLSLPRDGQLTVSDLGFSTRSGWENRPIADRDIPAGLGQSNMSIRMSFLNNSVDDLAGTHASLLAWHQKLTCSFPFSFASMIARW